MIIVRESSWWGIHHSEKEYLVASAKSAGTASASTGERGEKPSPSEEHVSATEAPQLLCSK